MGQDGTIQEIENIGLVDDGKEGYSLSTGALVAASAPKYWSVDRPKKSDTKKWHLSNRMPLV